jgi:hypothetical protein
MSAQSRTRRLHLTAVNNQPAGAERLRLELTPQLRGFLELAASAGLDHEVAVRLGLERALVLSDARELRLTGERARRILNLAGAELRANVALGSTQSAYLRSLYQQTASIEPLVDDSVAIELPEEILTLARDSITESALHDGAVDEMLTWERAARVKGRTMREWGLKALALALSRT